MKVHLLMMVYLLAALGAAQSQNGAVIPRVTIVSIEEGAVTLLHLAPGYATSVKLPEEISSVVVGDPASFRAEHSDAEPRLLFLKPITSKPSESNALVTTRSGHEITLHLLSAGKVVADPPIDFLLEYRRPQIVVVSSSDQQSLLIGDTHPISQMASTSRPTAPEKPDLVSVALEKQKSVSSPAWEGKEVLAALGVFVRRDNRRCLLFQFSTARSELLSYCHPSLNWSAQHMGAKESESKPSRSPSPNIG